MTRFLSLLGLCFCLTACGLADMPNKMDKTTEKIDETNKNMNRTTDKIEETNSNMQEMVDAVHQQILLVANDELTKDSNQALIFPVPTGLMAAGKALAEKATAEELMQLTHLWTEEIEQVDPVKGLDKDGAPIAPTEADLAVMRVQKLAKLYALMIIAGYTPDKADADMSAFKKDRVVKKDRITEIINTQILGYGRYQETALNFLALRAFFLREVMLKEDLKLKSDDAAVLTNSGMMNEAIKLLNKLNDISRLAFADLVQIHLKEKQYSLLTFDEAQNADGRTATAALWSVALDKAQAGMKGQKFQPWTKSPAVDQQTYQTELDNEKADINYIQTQVTAWTNNLN